MVNPLLAALSFFSLFSFALLSPSSQCHAHDSSGHDQHSMAMYFSWRLREYFFIEQWLTTSLSSYLASLAALFLLGIGNEYLRKLRSTVEDEVTPPATQKKTDVPTQIIRRERRTFLFVQKFALSFFQTFLSYSLMLTTMTFNIGVVIAVCLGLSTGSLLFPCKKSITDKEHCC